MVKLTAAEHQAITQAVHQAERKTAAEIVCVISPASDLYQSYVLFYGLLLGTVIAFGLWLTQMVIFYPFLVITQLGMTALVALPPIRRLCLWLVPKRIRYRRAAHRAFEEYLVASRHFAAGTPVMLLYVSIAERYAHILPSRAVREKIPDTVWDGLIQTLLNTAPSRGVTEACIEAIREAGALLAAHFPKAA